MYVFFVPFLFCFFTFRFVPSEKNQNQDQEKNQIKKSKRKMHQEEENHKALVREQTHINFSSPYVQEVVEQMKNTYPGGLSGYVNRAKELLKKRGGTITTTTTNIEQEQEQYKKKKRNLTLPKHRVDVDVFNNHSKNLDQLSRGNYLAGHKTAFVLVAGGLGERLGAQSLKISLPVHTLPQHQQQQNILYPDQDCFLHHYISWMKYCATSCGDSVSGTAGGGGAQADASSFPHLIIMTSEDTDDRTRQLLELNNYFGIPNPQQRVHLLKQTAVPCVCDNDGKLADSSTSSSSWISF